MKTCGYCLNYRSFEDRVCPASMATTLIEFCALDKDRSCAYANPACEKYEPDTAYIEFMEKERNRTIND